MSKEKRILILFYASVFLPLAISVIELLIDPPHSPSGWFAAIAFVVSVAVLLMMIFWIFRPQIRQISQNIALMNATIAQMKLLKTVASAANEAESVNEGLQIAVDTICEYTGWVLGHVFLYSDEKQKLVSSGIWHIDDHERCEAFVSVSSVTELAPSQGFIGEVYTDSTPMWILSPDGYDVHTRKEIAIATGLNAAFAFPIFIGRKAVGVMEFYSYESAVLDQELFSVMANIGKQLGQVIERAQAQERARLLETVLKSANDSIIITKAEVTNKGPEIIYVNEAFTKISGYAPSEAIGRPLRFLQSPSTNREAIGAMKKALVAGMPFKTELSNVSKEGVPYWIDMSIVPVHNAAGLVTHFAAIERDITARKEEEIKRKSMMLQLKRANMKAEAAARDLQESLEKAEAANKAKGDFLANMSDELRTPMNGVLGMAQLLTDSPLDAEQRELVSTINSSGESLLMLLNDILDFSKIEANALVLEDIAFNFTKVLHQTAHLMRPAAENKSIELMSSIDLDVPDYLWGDPGRLRQIITNLVGNAIKFTKHGYVRVKASVQESSHGDLLYVAVEDTGVGIPAHKLGEIFEKFTQADSSVTRKYGGTGLGLAITKQLVQLMGGEIGVESAEGKGSTFWFAIPCRAAESSDIHAYTQERAMQCLAVEHRKPIGEAKALLVDDYYVNRVFADKLLRKLGYRQIDVAENGLEAIEKYRTGSYDVIFIDCQMPELDGYQATQQLRMLEDGTPLHTPIIAMTANAMMGDREKCLKAGMDDYISKPLNAEHLRQILQAWFILDGDHAPVDIKTIEAPAHQEAQEVPVAIEQLRLFTDGDPEEEKALADLFLEQAQEMLVVLEQSIGADKNDAWKAAAHRFKGSSGNLGAMVLHNLCKRAEIHFEDEDSGKLEMLTAIMAETKRVELFFNPIAS